MPSRYQYQPPPPTLPVKFEVGPHVLLVWRGEQGRWSVTVDGEAVAGSFMTQAEAWECGVRDATTRDAPKP